MEHFVEKTLGNFIDMLQVTSRNLPTYSNDTIKSENGGVRYHLQSLYPLFNGFVSFRANTTLTDEYLMALKADFTAFPFTVWQVSDNVEQESDLLSKHDFVSAGQYKGILLDLTELKTRDEPADFVVKEASTPSVYQDYCAVINEVFGLEGPVAKEFELLLQPKAENDDYVHYVAYEGDKAISALTAFISGDSVGLYCGATLPEYRKQGALSQLTIKALLDAMERGCEFAVGQLMAKNMAENAAVALGAKVVCTFTPFVYGFDPNQLEK